MPEIDYLISDSTLVKDDEDQYFTEQVYKLPGCHMHADLYDLPYTISEPPCLKNGYITFGSMNNAHKISTEMISYWAEILKRATNSKLYFDARALSSECNKNYLIQQFQKQGIGEDRLIMNASLGRTNYLKSLTNIDIALDSTPYGGGTTTIETLSMGVPVITLYGNKWISRQASTFLKAIQHEELIAIDMNNYIDKTVNLATDIERLKIYRNNLGSEMKLRLNSDDYVKNFEEAIEDMWQQKCKSVV
jgi:predicted O-linked N-acetylglucosamine transferase (SPINDLY family)